MGENNLFFREFKNEREFYSSLDFFLTNNSLLHFRCLDIQKDIFFNEKYFILFLTEDFLIYKRIGEFKSGVMKLEDFIIHQEYFRVVPYFRAVRGSMNLTFFENLFKEK